MKTTSKIIIGLLLMSIFSFSNTKAGNADAPRFGKILQKVVTYPDFAKEQNLEGTVVVCFTVDTNGMIKVKNTSESDDALKDYVVKKLNNYKLDAKQKSKEVINPEECFYIKFVFKMENWSVL